MDSLDNRLIIRRLSTLEARVRALGFRRLMLDTFTRQSAALRLYPSTGYRETGRRKIRHLDVIDFEKDLEAPAARSKILRRTP